MSREINLSQVEAERISAEQEMLGERGPDEILSAFNPGVIVVPQESAYKFPFGLSGSLTRLTDDTSYLIAGPNINIVSASNGSITISAIADPPSPGGLDTYVQYNDGGMLGGDSAFTYNKSSDTLSVTNISGSLTKLANGNDYLVAGSGISLSTGSNGAITISSATPAWLSYTPTITASPTSPTLPSSYNLHGKYFVQGKLLTVIFNFSGNSSSGAAGGSGTYIISLPATYSIDTSVVSLGTSANNYMDGTAVGTASLITDNAGSGGAWTAVPDSTSSLVLVGQNPASATQPLVWNHVNYAIGSAEEYRVSFVATVPLT
jgi:hypothetical protein